MNIKNILVTIIFYICLPFVVLILMYLDSLPETQRKHNNK